MTTTPEQDPLDALMATLTDQQKDDLARGAIMVCATLGQEFEWEANTTSEIVGNLVGYVPDHFPAWYDQSTADENFWRRFTGADPRPTDEEEPDD